VRVQAGFDEFYRATYSRVVAELILLTGSRADAEDLAQEAFSRALARWESISRYDEPTAWVRRVSYNLAVSRWRSARRLLVLRPRLATEPTRPGPDADWLDLRDLLMALPVKQRQALLLTAVSGMTPEAAAREMGVPAATVRSWLHRARHAVRSREAAEPAEGSEG
jgi:RNA polymerase sigma-70 factor (ECF subfamily)